MPGTILVGLTGGIGSGKSTVSAMLAAMKAVIVDADAISRRLTDRGGAAIGAIRTQFGPAFITPEGSLDRVRMRELAFTDPDGKRRLEAIIHPLVGQATQQQASEAIDQGRPCVVFDIPLLVESGHWRSKLHRILVVDCTEQTQIERVLARNGLPRSEIERIIATQASRKQRLAAADIVIHNQGLSLDALRATVAQLAEPFGL
jgi:dephospho-CoA kinase